MKVVQALKEHAKVWKATNEDLWRRVELLSKEKAEKEEEHAAEIPEVITEVKGSAVVAIFEANIKLVMDVANTGSWNVVGWYEVLDKLTGENVNVGFLFKN